MMPAPSQAVFSRIAGTPGVFLENAGGPYPRHDLKSRQYRQSGWANGEYHADEVYFGSRRHRRLGRDNLGDARLGAPRSKSNEPGHGSTAVGVLVVCFCASTSGHGIIPRERPMLDRIRRQPSLWIHGLLRQSTRTRSIARPNLQSGMVITAPRTTAIWSGPVVRSFFTMCQSEGCGGVPPHLCERSPFNRDRSSSAGTTVCVPGLSPDHSKRPYGRRPT